MAHYFTQNPADLEREQLLPASSQQNPSDASNRIPAILQEYRITQDIERNLKQVESLQDNQLIVTIYDTILQRPPSDIEANDERIESIREHVIRQLREALTLSQQRLHNVVSQLQFDTISFTSEERKNVQLQSAVDELLIATRNAPPSCTFQIFTDHLDRLQEVFKRHSFYNQLLDHSRDTLPLDENNSLKRVTELYWARRIGISLDYLYQLIESEPSLIHLCEYMSAKDLPVELLPARIESLATGHYLESNEEWLKNLEIYYSELLPLEKNTNLLDPLSQKVLFSNSHGITSQLELLHSRRSEPGWTGVLACRILFEEGIKLLKRQRNLAHLAPEISRLVAEDYYCTLVSKGIQHGEALLPLIPKNTQRGFDKAVEVLRSQQLLKREYFSSPNSNKISHHFSPGGKDQAMWKAFLNLLVALERGIESFEDALRESKTRPEKVTPKSINQENKLKSVRALYQDSLTTLRVLTYQVGENSKNLEYQSQVGILKQSLTKVTPDIIQDPDRGVFEICKNYFFLPLTHLTDSSELLKDQFVLAQLIAIARRSCVQ